MRSVKISLCKGILMMLPFLFVACNDKEDLVENIKKEKVVANIAHSSINPYSEVYSEKMNTLFKSMKELLEKEESKDKTWYFDNVEKLLENSGIDGFSEKELEYMDSSFVGNLMKKFFRDVELYGLKYANNHAEETILKVEKAEVRDFDFKLVAIISSSIENYSDVFYTANTWEERFDNCMFNEAYDIFETGSIVQQICFIGGLPGTYIEMVADCAYAATCTPDDIRCQEKQPYKEDRP